MRRWLAAALLGAGSLAASAQSLDEALEGFGETPAVTLANPATPAAEDPAGELSGSLALSASYNYRDHVSANGTDWQGLSKLRTRLNLQYEQPLAEQWQFRVAGYGFYDAAYSLRERDEYSADVLDAYEHEAEWQEVWLRGKLRDDVDLKVGRQVVNWGRADSLRVLDVLNPLDNREPGLTDIEDIRLPVTMLKTDWFFAQHWQASFMAMPEMRFSRNPPYGSDFAVPLSLAPTGNIALRLDEDEPEHVADTAFAAAITGTFSGWDISFHAADLWRDTPYLRVNGPYTLALPSVAQQLEMAHSRYTLFGAGGNYIRGSWLFKAEVAWLDGIDVTLAAPVAVPLLGVLELPVANTQKSRIDVLAGIEYFGIGNTTLALEIANRHFVDYEPAMAPLYQQQDALETALRYTGTFIHDRLEVTALVIALGDRAQDGALLRLQAAYDIRDALVLTVGVVDYRHGDLPPFTIAENNDRLFAEIKYSF